MCLCMSTYFFVSTDNPENEDLYTSLRKGTTDKGIIYDYATFCLDCHFFYFSSLLSKTQPWITLLIGERELASRPNGAIFLFIRR